MGSAHDTITAMSLTLVTPSTTPRSAWPVSAEVCSAWMLARTTSAFSGDWSWNRIPGRRVIVHSVMSLLGVTDWARYGLALPSAPITVNESNRVLA